MNKCTSYQVAALAVAFLLIGLTAKPSKADLIVTWTDTGSNLELSIQGTWSEWEGTTVMTERDNILFGANGNTTNAFDLSRRGFGTTNLSGNPVGSFAILNVRSGSGSVSAPDFSIPPAMVTRYNLQYLNEGGFLELSAGIIRTEEFSVNEAFDLGTIYSLTPGTRTFNNSLFPGGETLTMNFVAVPEPSSASLVLCGVACLFRRRRTAHC